MSRTAKRLRRTVHLRTRGENSKCDCAAFCIFGSPPHTRRKCRHSPRLANRFPVHLRTRGENGEEVVITGKFGGSPPHTRRKFFIYHLFSSNVRFTSAHAEKIFPTVNPDKSFAVHLRTRGENVEIFFCFSL